MKSRAGIQSCAFFFRKLKRSQESWTTIPRAHRHPSSGGVKGKALLWKAPIRREVSCSKLPADHLQLQNRNRKSHKTNCLLKAFHYKEKKQKAAWDQMLPRLPSSRLLPGLADASQRKLEPTRLVAPAPPEQL